jgi:hypothetical protein
MYAKSNSPIYRWFTERKYAAISNYDKLAFQWLSMDAGGLVLQNGLFPVAPNR